MCLSHQVQNPIDLPQIVVVGSQSSGKSSVLENIVGRDLYGIPCDLVKYADGQKVYLEVPELLQEDRSSCNSSIALFPLSFRSMALQKKSSKTPRIRKPILMSGENFYTFQERNSTTSTRFVTRSSRKLKQKPAGMLAYH